MTQTAYFGGFYFDSATNPLAYHAVTASRNMPMVAPTIAGVANTRQWIVSRAIAKSAGSGEQVFTLMDSLLYGL
jgi:hypothetical protein